MAAIDDIAINPTAGSVTSQYSDIALTALFNAHVNIINSERAAIWQRQTAMTLANSIVLGFFVKAGQSDTWFLSIVGCVLGLALCLAWAVMSVRGWRFYALHVSEAARFSWPAFATSTNPFVAEQLYPAKHDWTHVTAHLVIALFGLTYLVALVWAIQMRP